MAEVTLDQILAAPDNAEALQRHMNAIGVLSPVAAPTPGPTTPLTPPSSATAAMAPSSARVAPMTPPAGGARIPDAYNHPNPREAGAPPTAAADPNIETGNPSGMTADAGALAPAPGGKVLPKLNFKERQGLWAGEPGTVAYDKSRLERAEDQASHPWGRKVFDAQGNEVKGEENHPGAIGKIGHVLAKVGNIAGDIIAPGTMSLIPGTELNRRGAFNEERRNLAADEARQTAEEAVRQRPEIAEMQGALKEQFEEARDRVRQGIATEHDKALLAIGAGHDVTKEKTTQENVAGRAAVAAEGNVSREKIAGLGKGDFDKYLHTLFNQGMPDSAANRLRAHRDWTEAVKNAGEGTFLPTYDEAGNITGAWDPKSDTVRKAPNLPAGGTTSQGQTIQNKSAKQISDYQKIIDHVGIADHEAQNPTGPGDYTILMSFVDATKPSSGFRFTEAERQQILQATALADRAAAEYDKLTAGPFLGPEQRQNMLETLHYAGSQAQQRLKDLQAGRVHASPGNDKPNPPAGTQGPLSPKEWLEQKRKQQPGAAAPAPATP